jgi:hypothetical protein
MLVRRTKQAQISAVTSYESPIKLAECTCESGAVSLDLGLAFDKRPGTAGRMVQAGIPFPD